MKLLRCRSAARGRAASHARSLAFLIALIAVQGLISITAVATALGRPGLRDVLRAIIQSVAPGPVGDALNGATDEAQRAGAAGRSVAITLGITGGLVTGTIAMAQLQRSFNRLHGIQRDRPTIAKYWMAARLTLSAGTLLLIAFAVIALGQPIGSRIPDNVLRPAWGAGGYVLGVVLVIGAVVMLLRFCPRRPSPGWRWHALHAFVAVVIGIYLLHLFVVPVATIIEQRTGLDIPVPVERGPAQLLVVAVASIAVAALSWAVLERPINSLKHRFPYIVVAPMQSTPHPAEPAADGDVQPVGAERSDGREAGET